MHLTISFILVLALIALGWMLFVVWLIATICSALIRFARRALGGVSATRETTVPKRCPRLRCRSENPGKANYCRRCGARIVRNVVLDPAVPDRSKSWVSVK